jgi:hypothetical protein
MRRPWPSRGVVMYGLVAAQLVVLAVIIAPQELNMALDAGPAVDVEILQSRGEKDPFRGSYVAGQTALDLEGSAVVLPAGLRGGDRVLVTFTIQPGQRPRIFAVERGRQASPFTATTFSLPGRVVDDRSRTSRGRREGRLMAYVGKPAVTLELDVPSSIAVDESALAHLSGPSIVRASLHAGFLGHRYFTDVRISGRQWPPDLRFTYDDTRQRLIVLAPRESTRYGAGSDGPVRTDLFSFDGAGKELGSVNISGRVVDATVEADGTVLALVSDQRWSSDVSLRRLGEDGRVLQQTLPIAFDRVLGFDAATASVWIVAAPTSAKPEPPHFIQRLTVAGPRDPRLGPFDSVPRAVFALGDAIWVLETKRHRITRLDAASGRVVREYRDLNDPVELAVDRGLLYVIEANRTQLTCIAEDGRVVWRVPRFHGLTWAVPDPATGGGWVGAAMFDGTPAGVLRFERDGAISRVAASVRPLPRGNDWQRRLGRDVVRSDRDGRLFFLEHEAVTILGADGAAVTRVIGFRFPSGQRLRS